VWDAGGGLDAGRFLGEKLPRRRATVALQTFGVEDYDRDRSRRAGSQKAASKGCACRSVVASETSDGSVVVPRRFRVSVAIKPLEDRILVQPLDAEQTTASGLVIPDTAKEKPQEGKVLAVGPGRFDEDGEKRIPLDISVGDVVVYSKYGGTEIKYQGEDYLILSARDVLAVVEK
jgi:chaperonin GroES